MAEPKDSFERYYGPPTKGTAGRRSAAPLDRRQAVREWPLEPHSWPVPVEFVNDGQVELLNVGDLLVTWDPNGYWLKTHAEGGYAMPFSFQALFNREGLPLCQLLIEISPNGPVCREVTIVGDPLTTTRIRLPLRELVEEATRHIGYFADELGAVPEPDEFAEALHSVTTRREPGKRLPDELLGQVAAVYRDAVSRGHSATDAVWEAFGGVDDKISRSTAGRWVVEARKRGFLGPAVPGLAGEQEPPRKEK